MATKLGRNAFDVVVMLQAWSLAPPQNKVRTFWQHSGRKKWVKNLHHHNSNSENSGKKNWFGILECKILLPKILSQNVCTTTKSSQNLLAIKLIWSIRMSNFVAEKIELKDLHHHKSLSEHSGNKNDCPQNRFGTFGFVEILSPKALIWVATLLSQKCVAKHKSGGRVWLKWTKFFSSHLP